MGDRLQLMYQIEVPYTDVSQTDYLQVFLGERYASKMDDGELLVGLKKLEKQAQENLLTMTCELKALEDKITREKSRHKVLGMSIAMVSRSQDSPEEDQDQTEEDAEEEEEKEHRNGFTPYDRYGI